MAPPPPRLCHVCATGAAKYKCPACRSPYCSAACYKTHKETPCGPQATAVVATPQAATSAAATPAAATATATSTTDADDIGARPPPLAPQKTQQQELEEAGVDPAQLLTPEQLSRLRASPVLLRALENPVVRTLLAKIESSANRTKELQKALLDPTFADFMYQTLDDVAAKS